MTRRRLSKLQVGQSYSNVSDTNPATRTVVFKVVCELVNKGAPFMLVERTSRSHGNPATESKDLVESQRHSSH